ncbi:cell division protein SepF [Pontibacillus halophilus JSM 076056 = DSM 19796]|uniref:Cell division protein SepF n=1 Tax=Pontibacillus halophilus JSM 076056 = DSM 19796 TaxID=1385510 RepID=A0A0A5GPR9_9BACI|nr:cell division protein SepF [Pontibacillus halophilus]KGX93248.1 cell division protein SepF [Pontibacillus halophilus JSM 076056 = DSM 19796]
MSIKNKLKKVFALDDEYEYEYVDESEIDLPEHFQDQQESQQEKKQNVVSLKTMQQSSKVVLTEPRSYNEAQEIADHLVNRRATVINLQMVDHTQAKRIVDFLSGTVYAIGGDIQKLGSQTFLCTPDNIDVSGSITEMLTAEDDYEKRW